jgi:quinol monooxygenase YgiN
VDRAAMDRHNNSEAIVRFFSIAKPLIDGEVTLVTGTELSAKSNDQVMMNLSGCAG